MVTTTRWNDWPRADFTPAIPRPELPPKRDPLPFWVPLACTAAIVWYGLCLGAGLAAGWCLVGRWF